MYEALCLPSRTRREGNRDRLCFLSHGDFAFSVPLLLGWLAERVSVQPHPVPQFLYIFWTRRAKCTFFPPRGEMPGKENIQNLSAGSSFSSTAEPSCSRKEGWMLTFETAKQRKQTSRHTFWSAWGLFLCLMNQLAASTTTKSHCSVEAP